jgi:hypothetical protein
VLKEDNINGGPSPTRYPKQRDAMEQCGFIIPVLEDVRSKKKLN